MKHLDRFLSLLGLSRNGSRAGIPLLVLACLISTPLSADELSGKGFVELHDQDIFMSELSFSPSGGFQWDESTGDSTLTRRGSYSLKPGGILDLEYEYTLQMTGNETPVKQTARWNYAYAGSVLVLYDKDSVHLFIDKPYLLLDAAAKASSELSETVRGEQKVYSAKNLVDHDPATFWAESVPGTGVGQHLDLELYHFDWPDTKDFRVAGMVIVNGVYGDGRLYSLNARAKTLGLEFGGPEKTRIPLRDENVPQIFLFEKPVPAAALKIVLAEAYNGSEWEDCCLSEIYILAEIPEGGK